MEHFQPAVLANIPSAQTLAEQHSIPVEEAQKLIDEMMKEQVFLNDQYQVNVSKEKSSIPGWPDLLHLSIKRRDKKSIRDWRTLQEIKNLIVGPEAEAVELFPAESRLVDTANQYHLYMLFDPETERPVRFPFGFTSRMVMDGDGEFRADGSRQRPFSNRGQKPFKRQSGRRKR